MLTLPLAFGAAPLCCHSPLAAPNLHRRLPRVAQPSRCCAASAWRWRGGSACLALACGRGWRRHHCTGRERRSRLKAVAADLEEELPLFCGSVSSPHGEILVVGVTHRDGGVSGRAVRRVIERFDPDVCFLELDQYRFSRLIADGRRTSTQLVPGRKRAESSLVQQPLLRLISLGIGAFSQLAGITNDENEFFEAFESAEACGALILPGDMSARSLLDGLGRAVGSGLGNPLAQIVSGARIMIEAYGGLIERPSWLDGPVRAQGIAVPAALLADGAGRAGPIVRFSLAWNAVGFLGTLILLAQVPGAIELGRLDASLLDIDALDAALVFTSLVFGGIVLSAFAVAALRDRDDAMAVQILDALALFSQLRGETIRSGRNDGDKGEDGVDACEHANPSKVELVWCRWTKLDWPVGCAVPVITKGVGSVEQTSLTHKLAQPDRLPLCEMSLLLGDERGQWAGSGLISLGPQLPLLELPQGLAVGETREITLSEPRVQDLMLAMAAADGKGQTFYVGIVHMLCGSERPLGQASSESAGALGVEVDMVLDSSVRVAEAELVSYTEEAGEHPRWTVRLLGCESRLDLRGSGLTLSCNEVGLLWARLEFEALASAPSSRGLDRRDSGRKARCVAVVGLLHVNGLVRNLQRSL